MLPKLNSLSQKSTGEMGCTLWGDAGRGVEQVPLRDMSRERAWLYRRRPLMSCCHWIIPLVSWPSSSTPWTARTGRNWAWSWKATRWERQPIIPGHC